MANARLDLLLESLAEVMETTAFISLSPLPENAPAAESLLVVTMEIGNNCRIHVAGSSALAAAVASSVLMLDPASREAQERGADAMKEILNVTAGLYLSRAPWLEGVIPEMQIPQARTIHGAADVEAWLGAMDAQRVLADVHPAAIAMEGRL